MQIHNLLNLHVRARFGIATEVGLKLHGGIKSARGGQLGAQLAVMSSVLTAAPVLIAPHSIDFHHWHTIQCLCSQINVDDSIGSTSALAIPSFAPSRCCFRGKTFACSCLKALFWLLGPLGLCE